MCGAHLEVGNNAHHTFLPTTCPTTTHLALHGLMDMAKTVVRIMLFFPNLYSNLVVSSAWHIFLLSAQQPPNNPKKPATTAIFEGNEGLTVNASLHL